VLRATGESVLNDAVAIVLFQSFDLIPEMHELSITWSQAGKMLSTFISVSFGSILIGISFGVFAAIVTRKVRTPVCLHVGIIRGLGVRD
jgi:NhaP-type Na+/H+ or K+/H+ antiporter